MLFYLSSYYWLFFLLLLVVTEFINTLIYCQGEHTSILKMYVCSNDLKTKF